MMAIDRECNRPCLIVECESRSMVGMWFLLELTILVVARKPLLKLLLSLTQIMQ
jgi:hypothetical protein